jgi:hypothetical protein
MIWEGKEVAYNQMKKDYLEACKQPLPGNDVVNRPPEDIEQPPVPRYESLHYAVIAESVDCVLYHSRLH